MTQDFKNVDNKAEIQTPYADAILEMNKESQNIFRKFYF